MGTHTFVEINIAIATEVSSEERTPNSAHIHKSWFQTEIRQLPCRQLKILGRHHLESDMNAAKNHANHLMKSMESSEYYRDSL